MCIMFGCTAAPLAPVPSFCFQGTAHKPRLQEKVGKAGRTAERWVGDGTHP